MKAEHRKELQTNVLADRLGRMVRSIKAGPKTTSITIWVVILLVIVVGVIIILLYRSSVENRSKLWVELDSATTKEDLQKIIDKNPGTVQARQASFELARYLLLQAQRKLYDRDKRTEALEDLKKAQDLYDRLADECRDAPDLAEEALMGSAIIREIRGELDKAQGYYDKLAKNYPKSFLGKDAAKEKEQEKDRQAFYEKLKEVERQTIPGISSISP